jgi:hypothetical protein
MPVEIKGGNTAQRALVRRAYEDVMTVLPSSSVIPIQIVSFPVGFPPGTEARSTPDGVQILAAVMDGPRGRAEYLLYEESRTTSPATGVSRTTATLACSSTSSSLAT